MDNYRLMVRLIQQAFPYDDNADVHDRVMLYETARRIRRVDHEKNRSKA